MEIYSIQGFNLFSHIVLISDFQPALKHMQLTQTTNILIKPCISCVWAEHLYLYSGDISWGHPDRAKTPSARTPKHYRPEIWPGEEQVLSSYRESCPGVSHLRQVLLVPNSGDFSPVSWETEDKKSARTKQQFRLERKHALMPSLSPKLSVKPGTAESFLRLLLLKKLYYLLCGLLHDNFIKGLLRKDYQQYFALSALKICAFLTRVNQYSGFIPNYKILPPLEELVVSASEDNHTHTCAAGKFTWRGCLSCNLGLSRTCRKRWLSICRVI